MASLSTPLSFPLGGDVFINTLCDVWAMDLIEITFDEAMKNDVLLQSPQAYTVTPLDGGDAVTVLEVQAGDESNTTTVWLVVTAPQIGKIYEISFESLFAVTGIIVTPNVCKLIGRATKEDSIINSRPKRYDMRPDAVYRKLVNALGREDDLIGGSRSDYFTTSIPAIIPIELTVSPTSAFIHLNATQQFTADVTGSPNENVYWYVNDILGGNSTVGTIDSTGLYTAPNAAADGAISVVKALAQINNALIAEAQVTFNQT